MDTSHDALGGAAILCLGMAAAVRGFASRDDVIPLDGLRNLERVYRDNRSAALSPVARRLNALHNHPVRYGSFVRPNAHLICFDYARAVLDAVWTAADPEGFASAEGKGFDGTDRLNFTDFAERWPIVATALRSLDLPDEREILSAVHQEAARLSSDHTEPPATPAIRAGQAFKERIENDPEARAAWDRARERMQSFVKAMQDVVNSPEYQEAEAAQRRAIQEVVDTIRDGLDNARGTLATRHLGRPETLEEWEHLARVIEMPDDRLRTGDYSIRDVYLYALAWADRQAAKAKLAAEAVRPNAAPPSPSAPPTWTQQGEGGTPPGPPPTGRPARDPNQPGRDRQSDILTAIHAAGTPLTRPELINAMKLKTEGKLGANLAWMVANNILVNVPQRGYWPAGKPSPE